MSDRTGALSAVEKIKEESRGLRGPLAAELAGETDHFSKEGAQLLKFHGVYQQEDRDARRRRGSGDGEPEHTFMVRCKIPGGVLTADQYLVLDDLAGRHGNGTLRVTTRQDNQFHGVLKGDLKGAIRGLHDTLVTTLGACGDVQRNVVCCPAPLPGGLRREALELARRISDHLLPRTCAYHEIWLDGEQVAGGAAEPEAEPIYGPRYLPRKFKTAIAFPDDNCTDVHSNDLGFLVVPDGDRIAGFNVLVGGGLGMTHGKRETYPRVADPLGWHDQGDNRWCCGLFVENGRIRDTTEMRLRTALRRIVQTFRVGVHLTPQQNLLLTDVPGGWRAAVEAILTTCGVPAEGAISRVRRWSMACPAMPTCGLAIAEAERALPGVIDELERELERLGLADVRMTVRMTGCPNGCARPYTADLAFGGRGLDKYTIFVGGTILGTRLGVAYADLVPRGRLVATVRPLLERYRAERRPAEGFGDFWHRVGIAALRADQVSEAAT